MGGLRIARTSRHTRFWFVVAAVALGMAGTPTAHAARRAASDAHAARTLNVADEAHLHLTTTAGELLEEEGQATGALPGRIRARFRVGATVSGSYTFYPRGGDSITGHGSAHLHSTGAYSSFSGRLTIAHGTGRYAHVHGSGGFYGVVNRRTNALTVQTTGRLFY